MVNDAIISMPDKWEYPWFAAWDLAFHTIALSTVDVDFASGQLELMLKSFYLHPTGQMPAYEWNFGDVNPPVHAWATIFLHRTEQALGREPDLEFLARVFTKLSLNFTWWTNRKDRFGKNLYEGGFLGLDNIGVFDRSAPLPTGGYLEQADGTAWMALFCQNMLEIGVELAKRDPAYEDLATKFVEQFPLDRPRDERGRPGRHVGRGGWVLLRRSSTSRRTCDATEGALHGGAAPHLRGHRHRAVAAGTGFRTSCGLLWNVCGECRTCSTPFTRLGPAISA